MEEWILVPTNKYMRKYKYYEKRCPREFAAITGNLDTYFETLKKQGNPLQIKAGFIHNEPEGIKGIDQKGGGQKVKLQQARLYVYPNIPNKTLYLLTIGNKKTQREDIKFCQKYVQKEVPGN